MRFTMAKTVFESFHNKIFYQNFSSRIKLLKIITIKELLKLKLANKKFEIFCRKKSFWKFSFVEKL